MNLVFRLAWRNLWRHPRRTWLTVGAIMFSNMLLVFMISLQFGMYGLMIDNTLQAFTGHLQIQAPGYIDDEKMRQTVDDIVPLAEKLRDHFDSDSIAARATAFALVSSEERSYGTAVIGVEPAFERNVSTLPGLVSQGRYLGEQDAAEIVIGAALARNLRVALGDELTLIGSGRDGSFAAAVVNIVGVFETGLADFDRSIIEIPLVFFQDVFYMDGSGHHVVINLPLIDDVPVVKEQVEALLPNGQGLVVHDWDALQPGLQQAIKADMSSAFFMYGILVILVAFSVLNTQLMSVLERTHEFGIVMSLGLTPGRLGRLVLLETAILGLLGLLFGALLGALVTYWFSVNGFSYPGMEEMTAKFNLPARFYPQVSVLSLLIGPVVVFIFTILAALYPALRLHKLHPVEAMRAV
ncbi:MAG: ABC transporter permease [Woeseiaceae bacterium]|nr:ABC transporter permease [Woeseiaceae bacterium]MDX2608757.1 ABC transporter permease [Woeseiaceae bacterium]